MWIKFLLLILLTNTALAHRVLWGEKVALGKGYVRSYTESDKAGNVLELGVAISSKALEGLGHEMKEYVVNLPEEANIPPYTHVTVNWNPMGHPPQDVYGAPHFDFHFFFIPRSIQGSITCQDADAALCMTPIPSQYLATAFVPTPGGVPLMGWHWEDSLSPEWNGGVFTRTWIYGYYRGETAFVEPMITLNYLASRETSVNFVRLPESFPYPGLYPKAYKITYDAKLNLHKVALVKFKSF